MRAAGRIGDCSISYEHRVGIAVRGSRNILINNRPALRIGDTGTYSTSYAGQEWIARGGAPRVLFNKRKAHRIGDLDEHDKSAGELIQGSPNVLIGDFTGIGNPSEVHLYDEAFILIYEDDGEPIRNRSYRIIRENGDIISGMTDDEGCTELVVSSKAELLIIEVLEDHDHE